MKKSLILGSFDRRSFERDVEEELRFHIEMQTLAYEQQGLTPDEALAKASARFGNVANIRKQCVQIGLANSVALSALKTLFVISFLSGILVRTFSRDPNVTQVGDILIMIGVLGLLLLFGKRLGSTAFKREGESIHLGLLEATDNLPPSFDEKGRTPFDRVRDPSVD